MYTIEELAKELNCDTETLLSFAEKKYIRPVTQDGEVYFYSKDTLKDLQENFNKYLTQLQKDTLDMQRMAETEELFNEMEIERVQDEEQDSDAEEAEDNSKNKQLDDVDELNDELEENEDLEDLDETALNQAGTQKKDSKNKRKKKSKHPNKKADYHVMQTHNDGLPSQADNVVDCSVSQQGLVSDTHDTLTVNTTDGSTSLADNVVDCSASLAVNRVDCLTSQPNSAPGNMTPNGRWVPDLQANQIDESIQQIYSDGSQTPKQYSDSQINGGVDTWENGEATATQIDIKTFSHVNDTYLDIANVNNDIAEHLQEEAKNCNIAIDNEKPMASPSVSDIAISHTASQPIDVDYQNPIISPISQQTHTLQPTPMDDKIDRLGAHDTQPCWVPVNAQDKYSSIDFSYMTEDFGGAYSDDEKISFMNKVLNKGEKTENIEPFEDKYGIGEPTESVARINGDTASSFVTTPHSNVIAVNSNPSLVEAPSSKSSPSFVCMVNKPSYTDFQEDVRTKQVINRINNDIANCSDEDIKTISEAINHTQQNQAKPAGWQAGYTETEVTAIKVQVLDQQSQVLYKPLPLNVMNTTTVQNIVSATLPRKLLGMSPDTSSYVESQAKVTETPAQFLKKNKPFVKVNSAFGGTSRVNVTPSNEGKGTTRICSGSKFNGSAPKMDEPPLACGGAKIFTRKFMTRKGGTANHRKTLNLDNIKVKCTRQNKKIVKNKTKELIHVSLTKGCFKYMNMNGKQDEIKASVLGHRYKHNLKSFSPIALSMQRIAMATSGAKNTNVMCAYSAITHKTGYAGGLVVALSKNTAINKMLADFTQKYNFDELESLLGYGGDVRHIFSIKNMATKDELSDFMMKTSSYFGRKHGISINKLKENNLLELMKNLSEEDQKLLKVWLEAKKIAKKTNQFNGHTTKFLLATRSILFNAIKDTEVYQGAAYIMRGYVVARAMLTVGRKALKPVGRLGVKATKFVGNKAVNVLVNSENEVVKFGVNKVKTVGNKLNEIKVKHAKKVKEKTLDRLNGKRRTLLSKARNSKPARKLASMWNSSVLKRMVKNEYTKRLGEAFSNVALKASSFLTGIGETVLLFKIVVGIIVLFFIISYITTTFLSFGMEAMSNSLTAVTTTVSNVMSVVDSVGDTILGRTDESDDNDVVDDNDEDDDATGVSAKFITNQYNWLMKQENMWLQRVQNENTNKSPRDMNVPMTWFGCSADTIKKATSNENNQLVRYYPSSFDERTIKFYNGRIMAPVAQNGGYKAEIQDELYRTESDNYNAYKSEVDANGNPINNGTDDVSASIYQIGYTQNTYPKSVFSMALTHYQFYTYDDKRWLGGKSKQKADFVKYIKDLSARGRDIKNYTSDVYSCSGCEKLTDYSCRYVGDNFKLNRRLLAVPHLSGATMNFLANDDKGDIKNHAGYGCSSVFFCSNGRRYASGDSNEIKDIKDKVVKADKKERVNSAGVTIDDAKGCQSTEGQTNLKLNDEINRNVRNGIFNIVGGRLKNIVTDKNIVIGGAGSPPKYGHSCNDSTINKLETDFCYNYTVDGSGNRSHEKTTYMSYTGFAYNTYYSVADLKSMKSKWNELRLQEFDRQKTAFDKAKDVSKAIAKREIAKKIKTALETRKTTLEKAKEDYEKASQKYQSAQATTTSCQTAVTNAKSEVNGQISVGGQAQTEHLDKQVFINCIFNGNYGLRAQATVKNNLLSNIANNKKADGSAKTIKQLSGKDYNGWKSLANNNNFKNAVATYVAAKASLNTARTNEAAAKSDYTAKKAYYWDEPNGLRHQAIYKNLDNKINSMEHVINSNIDVPSAVLNYSSSGATATAFIHSMKAKITIGNVSNFYNENDTSLTIKESTINPLTDAKILQLMGSCKFYYTQCSKTRSKAKMKRIDAICNSNGVDILEKLAAATNNFDVYFEYTGDFYTEWHNISGTDDRTEHKTLRFYYNKLRYDSDFATEDETSDASDSNLNMGFFYLEKNAGVKNAYYLANCHATYCMGHHYCPGKHDKTYCHGHVDLDTVAAEATLTKIEKDTTYKENKNNLGNIDSSNKNVGTKLFTYDIIGNPKSKATANNETISSFNRVLDNKNTEQSQWNWTGWFDADNRDYAYLNAGDTDNIQLEGYETDASEAEMGDYNKAYDKKYRNSNNVSSIDFFTSSNESISGGLGQAVVNRAEILANDPTIGYSQKLRYTEKYYDCSSFAKRIYLSETGIVLDSNTRLQVAQALKNDNMRKTKAKNKNLFSKISDKDNYSYNPCVLYLKGQGNLNGVQLQAGDLIYYANGENYNGCTPSTFASDSASTYDANESGTNISSVHHVAIYAGYNEATHKRIIVHASTGHGPLKDQVLKEDDGHSDANIFCITRPLNMNHDLVEKVEVINDTTKDALAKTDLAIGTEVGVPPRNPNKKTDANGKLVGYLPCLSYESWLSNSSTSPQGKIAAASTTDPATGIRVYKCKNGEMRYLVAMGSYYTKAGSSDCWGGGLGSSAKFDIVLSNGVTLPVIIGDQKADVHTDSTNRYHVGDSHYAGDGSVVELIVETSIHTKKRNLRMYKTPWIEKIIYRGREIHGYHW